MLVFSDEMTGVAFRTRDEHSTCARVHVGALPCLAFPLGLDDYVEVRRGASDADPTNDRALW